MMIKVLNNIPRNRIKFKLNTFVVNASMYSKNIPKIKRVKPIINTIFCVIFLEGIGLSGLSIISNSVSKASFKNIPPI